jgi:hypothetical protein
MFINSAPLFCHPDFHQDIIRMNSSIDDVINGDLLHNLSVISMTRSDHEMKPRAAFKRELTRWRCQLQAVIPAKS